MPHARLCSLPVEQLAMSAGAPRQTASVGMLERVWVCCGNLYIYFPRALFVGQYAWHDGAAYKRDMCMQYVTHRPSITMAVSFASAPRLVCVA